MGRDAMKINGALALPLLLTLALPDFAAAQTTGGVKSRKRLKAPDDDSPTETTLEIDEGAFLGYGGFRWGTQLIDGHWTPSFGVRGMWLYQETAAIGIDFAGPKAYYPFTDDAREGISQSLVTWGVSYEHINKPREEFHSYYGLTFGRG